MPDLQTALTNAIHSKPALNATINDWEKHEQVIRQPQQEKVEEKPAQEVTETQKSDSIDKLVWIIKKNK